MHRDSLVLSLAAFLAICVAFALFASVPVDWAAWREATCFASGCFCEAIRNSEAVRQPSNAWSSLAFALVGLVVAGTYRHERRTGAVGTSANPIAHDPFYAAAFAVSAIVIGLGSAFYHASLTFAGQFFDVFGMYLLTTLMLAYALRRLLRLRHRATVLGYLLLNIPLTWLLIVLPEFRRSAFALVLIAALILEVMIWRVRRPALRRDLFVGGFALFTGSYAIWILDNRDILCAPTSLLQGHAAWHVLGAAATWLLYRYYMSENASHA